jgi:hypothetical protein
VSHIRIHFRLEQVNGYPPDVEESLWTQVAKGGEGYVLDNIPFFVSTATLGDRVSATNDDDGRLWYLETIERSTNSLLRVVVFQGHELEGVASALRDLGCDVEVLVARSLLAVNVPSEVDLTKVQDYLVCVAEQGSLDYEEPLLRQ